MRTELGVKFLLNGLAGGIIFGNISLGIFSAAMAILYCGFDRKNFYIIWGTIITVILSGNINFELVFLFFWTTAFLLQKKYIDSAKVIIISVLLIPFWRLIFGYLPVSVIEDISISGGVLLFLGIIISIQRSWELLINSNLNFIEFMKYILILLAIYSGIYFGSGVLIIWFIIFLTYYFLNKEILYIFNIFSLPKILSSVWKKMIIVFIHGLAFVILVPFNISYIFFGFFWLVYYYYNQNFYHPEVVYASFLLSLICSTLGIIY